MVLASGRSSYDASSWFMKRFYVRRGLVLAASGVLVLLSGPLPLSAAELLLRGPLAPLEGPQWLRSRRAGLSRYCGAPSFT